MAATIRRRCLNLGHAAGSFGAHYGPALSIVEILAVLYSDVLRIDADNTNNPDRDRFILSKGHGSLALYATLFEFGFIPPSVIETCEQDGSPLPGQPIRNIRFGIEFSSGSLGMGLGYGVGLALSARLRKSPSRAFVLMGDGETNEGSVWEAAQSARHYNLSNLIAVIDSNSMQSDGNVGEVMTQNQKSAWSGFGWHVVEVADGHDTDQLRHAFSQISTDRPTAVIANTIKGAGVSFMEGNIDWHHGVLTASQLNEALAEVIGRTDS